MFLGGSKIEEFSEKFSRTVDHEQPLISGKRSVSGTNVLFCYILSIFISSPHVICKLVPYLVNFARFSFAQK